PPRQHPGARGRQLLRSSLCPCRRQVLCQHRSAARALRAGRGDGAAESVRALPGGRRGARSGRRASHLHGAGLRLGHGALQALQRLRCRGERLAEVRRGVRQPRRGGLSGQGRRRRAHRQAQAAGVLIMTNEATLAELMIVAASEAWRDNGEVLASGITTIPRLGASLAKLTHSPELLMTDSEAFLVSEPVPLGPRGDYQPKYEGYMSFERVFECVWGGKRHVMIGPTQVDRWGQTNLSIVGDYARPK